MIERAEGLYERAEEPGPCRAWQRQMLGSVKCRERELLIGAVKGPLGGYSGIVLGYHDHHSCHNCHNLSDRQNRYDRQNR